MFDTAFSRNFSLLESQREFVQRFREQASSQQALPVLASACPGAHTADQLSWMWEWKCWRGEGGEGVCQPRMTSVAGAALL